jgi:hypothetical protein
MRLKTFKVSRQIAGGPRTAKVATCFNHLGRHGRISIGLPKAVKTKAATVDFVRKFVESFVDFVKSRSNENEILNNRQRNVYFKKCHLN